MTPELAKRLARERLSTMPRRLGHVEAVAARAAMVAGGFGPSERAVIVAGAWLHDIGYAESLAGTGFHHLDGAVYLRELGEERLAGLIAYHSAGAEEARLRGLADQLSSFADEDSVVSRTLTYCDVTTRSDGQPVDLDERTADVRERYGDVHVVTRSLIEALPRLRQLVAKVEARQGAATATR